MSPLEAALVVAAFVLPLHRLICWQASRVADPAYIRRMGVVIRREEAIRKSARVIGRYQGCDIAATVIFMDMIYRFDRVVPPFYRSRVTRCELFLEPGLVYVTD